MAFFEIGEISLFSCCESQCLQYNSMKVGGERMPSNVLNIQLNSELF